MRGSKNRGGWEISEMSNKLGGTKQTGGEGVGIFINDINPEG